MVSGHRVVAAKAVVAKQTTTHLTTMGFSGSSSYWNSNKSDPSVPVITE
jgi:hypothetical protein